MKFIINGKFVSQRLTGVQRVAWEIIKRLDNLVPSDITLEIAVPKGCKKPVFNNISVVECGRFSGNLWEQISFPRYVKKNKAVHISLCNSAPLYLPGVVMIHDTKIHRHPEFFSKKFVTWYKFMFKRTLKKPFLVINNSIFTKDELIHYYPKIDESKILVMYLGHEHFNGVSIDKNILSKFELKPDEYYFSLGSMEPNKNLKYIINLANKNPNEMFVVAGGINSNVFSSLNMETPKNVKLVGYVSDVESKSLMHYSKAFIFPSIYEGFGIPPLEAIVSGCKKLLISDIPVLREIYGDSANYLDLNNVPDDLSVFDKEVGVNAKAVLDKCSWDRAASLVMDALIKINQELSAEPHE